MLIASWLLNAYFLPIYKAFCKVVARDHAARAGSLLHLQFISEHEASGCGQKRLLAAGTALTTLMLG